MTRLFLIAQPQAMVCLVMALCLSQFSFAAPPVDVGKAPGRLIVRAMDTDNDGFVSREEFKPLKRGSRWEWFDDADEDRDEALTREELDGSLKEATEQQANQANGDFARSDLNEDGVVTLAELRELMFIDFDINEDGQLDEDELGSDRQEQRLSNRSDRGGSVQRQ